MQEFKSSIFVVVKNIIYGIFGGGALAVIAYIFLPDWVAIAVGAAALVFMVYSAVFGDRIRVVVEDDRFSVYRRKRLRHRFVLDQVSLHARIKTVDTDSDCTLTVQDANGEETRIDCSLLGANRFYRLLDALHVTEPEPVKVNTIKK